MVVLANHCKKFKDAKINEVLELVTRVLSLFPRLETRRKNRARSFFCSLQPELGSQTKITLLIFVQTNNTS